MSSLPFKGILMQGISHGFTKKFYAIGVNFHKTDTQQRSKYSITTAQIEKTYGQSSPCLEHYLILSTCNRTEIYGFAPCEYVILAFLKTLSGATHEEIVAHTFI